MILSTLLVTARADFSSISRRPQSWAFSFMPASFVSNTYFVDSSSFAWASNRRCFSPTFLASTISNSNFNSNSCTLAFFVYNCRIVAPHSLHLNCRSSVTDRRSSTYPFLDTGNSNPTAESRECVSSSPSSVIPSASPASVYKNSFSNNASKSAPLLAPARSDLHRPPPADGNHHNPAKSMLGRHATHRHGSSQRSSLA